MVQEDGSFQLVQTLVDAEGIVIKAIVGEVEPAWAVDANGDPVETWYEVTADGSLMQVIDPDDSTEYPVVADPRVIWSAGSGGIGYFVTMTATEMKALAIAITSLGGAVAAATCVGLTKLPVAIAKFAQAACSLVGGLTLQTVYKAVLAAYKAPLNSWCYMYPLVAVNAQNKWVPTSASNC